MPGNQRSQEDKQGPGGDGVSVSPPVISSPKGGGAIRGIGEKFAANPVTGTGSMTVPIATSPGRSGFGPQLSLSYDSGAGNGPFGFGWSLSLPNITRKTDKGLPQYWDSEESDVFILSGAEDLVPVLVGTGGQWRRETPPQRVLDGEDYKIQCYRPRIEGLFARIEQWTNQRTGEIHWRSITRDNVTTLYGKNNKSRIFDPAAPDPEHPNRIFSWLISESYDDKGNAIVYEYTEENTNGVNLSQTHEKNRSPLNRSANRYLKRIKYGNRVSRLVQPDLSQADWMFEVVFDYGEHHPDDPKPNDAGEWLCRHDPFSSYRAGFEVRTYRLCQRVLMFHHFRDEEGVGQDCLVRSTDFVYQSDRHNSDDLRKGHPVASVIASVTQSGYKRQAEGGYLKKALPPLEFEYSESRIDETIREVDAGSLENLPSGVDGSHYQWVDLDGEGISCILTEQGDGWFYKRNLSPVSCINDNGSERSMPRFGPQELIAARPNATLSAGRAQFMDLAGDGQIDLVEFSGTVPGFYERTGDQGWEQFRTFASLPNIPWNDPNLKFVDLTGDGHADILITEEDVFTWYPSLAEAGFDRAERRPQPFDEEEGPLIVFDDGTQSVYLADLSGDGLSDLVRVRNGEVCYWPNLGYGKFGTKVTMDNSPWFDAPDLFDKRRIRLADIDGSGATDIIYLGSKDVAIYRNECGNRWSDPEYLNSFPPIDNLSSVVAIDLLGNGTACLVWSSLLPGDSRRTMRYIDLMGGQKPHLLIKSKNNLGAETHVQYTPSTRFYLQDKQNGTPWITRLPFPVHCVEKVIIKDNWRQTEFTTTYSYHHGYFDGVEREFRGFGRVEQIDVETFDKFAKGNATSPYITDDKMLFQPPVKTVTWYHTGAFLDRQRILSHFSEEYFPTWFEALRPNEVNILGTFQENILPEPDLDLEGVALTAEEWREALRACKGMMLRQEVYELDVDALEQGKQQPVKIFTTAYHNCHIRLLQPKANNQHAVFHVTESEAITYHYELDLRQQNLRPDPRIAHALNLNIDEYGNVLQSVAVVYPRIGSYTDNLLATEELNLIARVQQEPHLTYTENRFTNDEINDDDYRLRLLYETSIYQLTGISPQNDFYFSLDELRGYQFSGLYPAMVNTVAESKAVTEIKYQEVPDGVTPQKRLIEQARMLYFDKNLKDPLPLGTLNWLGILYETYKLALTDDLLKAVHAQKLTAEVQSRLSDSKLSGYLCGAALSARFGGGVLGQYWIRSGIAGFADDAIEHFYLPERYTDPFGNTTTVQYDTKYDLFVESSTDPVDNTVKVEQFDFRVLAPQQIRDINNNLSEVFFDVLGMPVATALKGKGDEADNLDGFDDALANPDLDSVITFFTGNYDEARARLLLGNATARYVYYFGEAKNTDGSLTWGSHPACACGILREKHVARLEEGEQSPLQAAFEYSDGMGTVLVKKGQAEPETGSSQPRWIATGKTILNNKGKPVKQYEPFFSENGHKFEEPGEVGVTPVMYYDAVGRLIRTELPDGSCSRVEFSPWYVMSYDPNDTILEPNNSWYVRKSAGTATPEEQRAAQLTSIHAGTPGVTILDSLGRDVITIAHNRYQYPNDTSPSPDEKHLTFTKLDAEGKPLWICDARKNLVMQYIQPPLPDDYMHVSGRQLDQCNYTYSPCYDIAGNLLFQHSMDTGDRWMLNDAAGKPVYAWEANTPIDESGTAVNEDRLFHTAYDALHRPMEQWFTINDGNTQLIEKFIYGDQIGDADDARSRNLRGQLYQHYDQSGLKNVEFYDFKGNPREAKRRLAGSYKAPVLDWQGGSPTAGLEPETFTQLTEYDALNRMSRLFNWHLGTGSRVAVYEPCYSRRGLLESEELVVRAVKTDDGYKEENDSERTKVIEAITYDAKGQREAIQYGNGTTTRYQYDPDTFRLVQLRTTRAGFDPKFPDSASLLKDEKVLQNLYYTYDPVGNITRIYDDAYKPAFFRNQQVEPESQYTYDALYRLIAATGRENCQAGGAPGQVEPDPFVVQFPVGDPKALRNYNQAYKYDAVGNITEMKHAANGSGWTRQYDYAAESNRLSRTWLGSDTLDAIRYQHDNRGNMLNLANVAPEYYTRWDYRDMIQSLNLEGGGWAYYNYDAGKQRTRKVIENKDGVKQWERFYLGGFEIYRRYDSGKVVEVIETLHLTDGDRRVLLVEDVRQTDNSNLGTGMLYRYQYGNHLGSAVLELDDQSAIISYEEYHPYGTTAYRAVNKDIKAAAKRYRYTGMEMDDESGLNYHGARYYAPWTGRWCSVDPIGLQGGINAYQYVSGNPINKVDKHGTQATVAQQLAERQAEIVATGKALRIRDEHKRIKEEMRDPNRKPEWQTRPLTSSTEERLVKTGVVLLVGGLLAIPSGGSSLFGAFAIAGGISGGIAVTATGIGLGVAKDVQDVSPKDEWAAEKGAYTAANFANPVGAISGTIGALKEGTLEGAEKWSSVGTNAFYAVGGLKALYDIAKAETIFQLNYSGTNYYWNKSLKAPIRLSLLGQESAPIRENPLFYRGVEYMELSHWFPQRYINALQLRPLLNRPINLTPRWGTEHALLDPSRFYYTTEAFKEAYGAPHALPLRILGDMPPWMSQTAQSYHGLLSQKEMIENREKETK